MKVEGTYMLYAVLASLLAFLSGLTAVGWQTFHPLNYEARTAAKWLSVFCFSGVIISLVGVARA